MFEKLIGGTEDLGLPAFATDERFERFAHRNIVVHHKNNRGAAKHAVNLDAVEFYPSNRPNRLQQQAMLRGFNSHATASFFRALELSAFVPPDGIKASRTHGSAFS